MSPGIGLAAAAYRVAPLATWADLRAKLAAWLRDAKGAGADLVAFPEYAGLEAALVGTERPLPILETCTRAASCAADYAALCADLARAHGLWVLSGSLPAPHGPDLVNRAWLCAPNGDKAPIDKQILTPWERRNTPLAPGLPPQAFDTELGRIGVLICYDAEFPALAQALSADILLLPACTDGLAGHQRLRNAARARALEGQCVTLHAPLVGPVPICPMIDINRGQAGIFGPPDIPFPDNGILAERPLDDEGWAHTTLPPGALATNRRDGHVAPLAHLSEARQRARNGIVAPLGS